MCIGDEKAKMDVRKDRDNRIRNENIRRRVRVALIVETMRENRLIRFEHVMRRYNLEVVRVNYVECKYRKGRIEGDMKINDMNGWYVGDQDRWDEEEL